MNGSMIGIEVNHRTNSSVEIMFAVGVWCGE